MKTLTLCLSVVVLCCGLSTCGTGKESAAPTASTSPQSESSSEQRVTIRVEGMTKIQGITWIGWPNKVEDALRALPGVSSLETDLKNDAFRVTYDPGKVTENDMLSAIRGTGFTGAVVDDNAFSKPATNATIRWTDFPEDLQAFARQAQDEKKLVLIDVHGPG